MCIFLTFLSSAISSQPCLSGWKYRREVSIDNSASLQTLSNYQIKLGFDTRGLIAAGKLNISGSDIRLLDENGSVLPYWIENETINQATTFLWIKVPTITAGSIKSIYLFYGNLSAAAFSNGVNTFELFDDFDGNSIDNAKWSSCGLGSINISNGKALVATADRYVVYSNSAISGNVICEMDVEAFSGSGAFIGQYNNTAGNYAGYSLFYQNESGSGSMRLRKTNTTSECGNMSDQSPSTNVSPSNSIIGTWSLSWPSVGTQFIDWPGASVHPLLRSDNTSIPSNNKKVFWGNAEFAGSVSIDWLRVRKYTDIELAASLGIEIEFPAVLNIENSGPVCENENLQLFVNAINGAQYSWSGPLGFTSADQNPIISTIGLNQAGIYELNVTIPTGCASYIANTVVTVNTLSIGGNLSGNAQVCSGNNNGIISLSGFNGNIIRWEISASGNSPWSSINWVNTTIPYINLLTSS